MCIADLIRAHCFLRVLDDDPLQHVDAFRADVASDAGTFNALCDELSLPLNLTMVRALCGFVLLVHTNSLFQRAENFESLAELVSSPREGDRRVEAQAAPRGGARQAPGRARRPDGAPRAQQPEPPDRGRR